MKSFTDEKSATEFIEKKLEAKYGEKFTVMSIEYDTTYPQADVVTAHAYPLSDPEKSVYVYARSTGLIEDTYSEYLFKDEAEAFGKGLLSDKAYILSCEVKLKTPTQSKTWEKEEGFMEYISQDGLGAPMLDFTVTLHEGLEINEYAEQVFDILQTLYEPGINAELWADASGENIFLDNHAGSPPPNPYSLERIEKIIEDSIDENQRMQDSLEAN